MTTGERIESDFRRESKARNASAVSALRMLRAALKNAEIDKMKPLDERDVLSVISKEVKKLKDALESFVAGKRDDLAGQARNEIALLERYLPEQLTDDEIREIVKKRIATGTATAKDFGRVMSQVMKDAQGRADGSRVGAIVKEVLAP